MFKYGWVALFALLIASGCSDDTTEEPSQNLVFLEFQQVLLEDDSIQFASMRSRTSTPDLIENPPVEVVERREMYAELLERESPPAGAVPDGCELSVFTDDGGIDNQVFAPPMAGLDLGQGVVKVPDSDFEAPVPLSPDAFNGFMQPVTEITAEYTGGADFEDFSISGTVEHRMPRLDSMWDGSVLTIDVQEARGGFDIYTGDLTGYLIECRELRQESYVFDFEEYPDVENAEQEVGFRSTSENETEKILSDGTRVHLKLMILQ